tara:strand:+ start:581 stop:1195 length:615 start_codon:yes stop_codon:yes gene_type:complete
MAISVNENDFLLNNYGSDIKFNIYEGDKINDDIITDIEINPDDFPNYSSNYYNFLDEKNPNSFLLLAIYTHSIIGFVVLKIHIRNKSIIVDAIETNRFYKENCGEDCVSVGTLMYAKIFNYFKTIGYNFICASDASAKIPGSDETINSRILSNISLGRKDFLKYNYPQCNFLEENVCPQPMSQYPFPFCLINEQYRLESIRKEE